VFNLDSDNQLLDHSPDAVLGQTDFYSNTTAVAQNRFNAPKGLALDQATNRLFVVDYGNSRVLVFDVASITNGENAVNVLGQANFTTGTGATSQTRLKNPAAAGLDGSRGWLFVGDYANNRVMVFDVNTITDGEAAINVLGQTSWTTSTAATTQSGMRNPCGVSSAGASGRLYVADASNHRVLVFDASTLTNGENAINVLGQSTFTTSTSATTQTGMKNPRGVAIDVAGNHLFVADSDNHRVTVFDVSSITNGEAAVAVLGQVNFTSGAAATAQNRMSSPAGLALFSTPFGTANTTVTYTYDPLYRLTAADFNTGVYFHYTYDATGNRLTEVTRAGTTSYVYDIANRLTSVGGVSYTWDNNGNLLSDGVSTYTYNKANRLATVVQGSTTYGFTYNGLGDRLRQTVNGTSTTYALDLASGLTQVLTDGSNLYLYGVDRVGEKQAGGWRYYTQDALGSVRQLVNSSGSVLLAKSFAPFGDILTASGSAVTIYGFTGEQRDPTGLIFLRARYLSPAQGRFLTRDIWEGDPENPAEYDAWSYVSGNPASRVDPTGRYWEAPWCERLSIEEQREDCRHRTLDNWSSRWMEPPYVEWNPPQSLALLQDLPFMSPGAQGHVNGYDDGTYPNFCGQIAIAAILGLDAAQVVRDFDRWITSPNNRYHSYYDIREETSRGWLVDYINERRPGWHATMYDWHYLDDRDSTLLRSLVSATSHIIALVGITDGNIASPTPQGGTLGTGEHAIGHFVVITGFSRNWIRDPRSQTDPRNWVRIYNPFTNGTEYYRFVKGGGPGVPRGGFLAAWHEPQTYAGILVTH
jgi:RHS repeat-associated protein